MLIVQGLNGLNGASDVLALNSALVKLGYKDVPFTSMVSDQTAAALWDAIKGNLAKVRSVAASLSALPGTASASTAVGWLVDSMSWIDKQLGDIPYLDSIPGVTINTHFVLAHWADLNAVMGGACSLLGYTNDNAGAKCKTVVGVLAAGRTKTYEGIAAAAGVFAKVLTAIGAGATTDASTTPTTAAAIRAAQIQAMNAGAGADRISAGLAPMVTTHDVGGLPKWALFALIAAGLVGGVLLARRAA